MTYLKEQWARSFVSHIFRSARYNPKAVIKNPALAFRKDALAGKYDQTPESLYRTYVESYEAFSALMLYQPERDSGSILFTLLRICPLTTADIDAIVDIIYPRLMQVNVPVEIRWNGNRQTYEVETKNVSYEPQIAPVEADEMIAALQSAEEREQQP